MGLFVLLFNVQFGYTTTIHTEGYETYTVQEEYWDKEPYQTRESYCSDYSWWSGNCVDYSFRTITKYRDVKRYRPIQKQRRIDNSREEARQTTLWKMATDESIWVEEIKVGK